MVKSLTDPLKEDLAKPFSRNETKCDVLRPPKLCAAVTNVVNAKERRHKQTKVNAAASASKLTS